MGLAKQDFLLGRRVYGKETPSREDVELLGVEVKTGERFRLMIRIRDDINEALAQQAGYEKEIAKEAPTSLQAQPIVLLREIEEISATKRPFFRVEVVSVEDIEKSTYMKAQHRRMKIRRRARSGQHPNF